MSKLNMIHSLFTKENISYTRSYAKDEVIAFEGDKCLGIGLVLDGSIVFKNTYEDGHETIVKYAYQSELFGEVLVFSNSNLYPASIFANEDTRISYISQDRLFEIIKKNPDISIALLQSISEKTYVLNNHIKLLNNRGLRSKISYYLYQIYLQNKNRTFKLDLNRDELARYLNVERPSLSRELIKMKKEGLIDFYLNQITIIDIKKIQQSI